MSKLENFIKKAVQIAQNKVHTHLTSGDNCVLLLTAVLTEPDWITMECNENITNLILCQKTINHTTTVEAEQASVMYNNKLQSNMCEQGELFFENRCVLFKLYKKLTNLSMMIQDYSTIGTPFFKKYVDDRDNNIVCTEYFTYIQHFYLQPIQFAISFSLNMSSVLYTAIQSPVYEKLNWIAKQTGNIVSQYDGYLLIPMPETQIKVKSILYQCSDGTYIDQTLSCNNITDCITGTDEENCVCQVESQSKLSISKYLCKNDYEKCTCSDSFFQCSTLLLCIPFLFVCDGKIDCPKGDDEFCSDIFSSKNEKSVDSCGNTFFRCIKSNISIPISFVDDLVPDCPYSFEDELQYYNLLTNPYHVKQLCNSSYELPCVSGHNHCFPLSKLCIYDFQYNTLNLMYCRNGAHLHNCKYLQCPGFFKCPLSYCIAFDLVCNGNWDCPQGYDEQNCLNYSCIHLFKCRNQRKCLHFSKVCDSNKNSMHGDDELSCSTGYLLSCPLQCICFSQSIVCNHFHNVQPYEKLLISVKSFKCYRCALQFSHVPLSIFMKIKCLHIREYMYSFVCLNKDMSNSTVASLRILDVASNRLQLIKRACFISFQILTAFKDRSHEATT